MRAFETSFQKAVERWWNTKARIRVELTTSSPELPLKAFTGTVANVDWPLVTFRDESTGTELNDPLDFSDADIRGGSFDKIDAEIVCVFSVAWNVGDFSFVRASFTELRDLGKPN
jgi:hypothetical protein